MAVTPVGSGTASTSNASSYASGSFTPAEGDLLVVVAGVTATALTPTCSASANGITFDSPVFESEWSASAHKFVIFVAEQLVGASPSSMTVTVGGLTGDAGSGCNISVFRVSGMSRVGAAAVRQVSTDDPNGVGTGAAYALGFGAATLTGNPIILGLANNSNPAGITPPSSFTEAHDIGYATPSAGLETCYRTNGTSSTYTFGSTSATVGVAGGIELDARPYAEETLGLSGSGSVSLTGALGAQGSLATSGAGSLSLTGVARPAGALAVSGSGSISLTGVAGPSGALPLAGSGSVSLSGVARPTGALGLSGSGTWEGSGEPGESEAFSGTLETAGSGSLSLTGVPGGVGALGLGGSGSVSLAGGPVGASGALGLAGGGSLSLTGRLGAAGTLGLAGAGSLSLTGVPGGLGALALAGAGSVSLTGVPRWSGLLELAGAGSVEFSGQQITGGELGLSGSGSLSLTGGAPGVGGTLARSGSGSLVLTAGLVSVGGSLALSGAGALVLSTAGLAVGGSLDLAGVGAWVGSGRPGVAGVLLLEGDGSLVLVGAFVPPFDPVQAPGGVVLLGEVHGDVILGGLEAAILSSDVKGVLL